MKVIQNAVKKAILSPRIIILSLGIVFFLSFVLFFFTERKSKALLFYPVDNKSQLQGDFHILPSGDTERDRLEILLSETLLSPFDYRLNPIVPEGVRVNSLMLTDENTLYIDLSIEMAGVGDKVPTSDESRVMFKALEKNILFNFKRVKNVCFSVDGEVPFAPVFNGSSS